MDFGVRRTALDDWERRAPSRRPRAPPRAPSRAQMLDGQIERFFVCLRAEVAKAAKNRRWQQSINRNTRMSMTSQELRMVLYRKVMRARFLKREALLGEADDGDTQRVPLEAFRDTLESFETAGQDSLSEEAADRLWRRFDRGNYSLLIDEIFPRVPRGRDTAKVQLDKHFFAKPAETHAYDPDLKSDERVEEGPFDIAGNGVRDVQIDPGAVPDRITYAASKTAVQPPTNWDTREATRSAQLPQWGLQLEHVHGYNGRPNGNSLFHNADGRLVYYVAAVGVVYDPAGHRQVFFQKHTDDITAMALNTERELAATGQLGRAGEVVVHVWRCAGAEAGQGLYELGRGFYTLQVAALSFSRTGAYLAIVGGDTGHTLGVWPARPGAQLAAQYSACNGTPPQVFNVCWSPVPTEDADADAGAGAGAGGAVAGRSRGRGGNVKRTLTRRRAAPRETFATAGMNNLKFWTFAPGTDEPLTYTSARYGDYGQTPRSVTALTFNGAGRAVTGNDDGRVCLWSGASCVFSFHAHRGPVHCLATTSSHIYSGGEDGVVRFWNLEDLSDPEHTCICSRAQAPEAFDAVFSHRPHRPSFKPRSMRSHPLGNPSQALHRLADARERTRGNGNGSGSGSGASRRRKQLTGADIGVEAGGAAVTQSGRAAAVRSMSLEYLDATDADGNLRVREIVAGTVCSAIWRIGGHKHAEPELLLDGHYGDVNSVATHPKQPLTFATVGAQDRTLYEWDIKARKPLRAKPLPSPATCVDYKPDGSALAVGLANGSVLVLGTSSTQRLLKSMQDSRESITEVRYSPDGYSLAVASQDHTIRIYDATRGYLHVSRCSGHQAGVTHLDWSVDSSTLQSNCGTYEIMYWNADTGKQIRSSVDTVESDTEWATWTCILGFPVMGIWPDGSDGTDVNAVDRSKDGQFVVTADDFGQVKVFNYPCVVDDAPCRVYKGHAAHVQRVRLSARESHAISVGGSDTAVMQWRVVKVPRNAGDALAGTQTGAAGRRSAGDPWVPCGFGSMRGGQTNAGF